MAVCPIEGCDGVHMRESRCHFCANSFKAKGCCGACYKQQRRVYSERSLPKQHVLVPAEVREIRHLYSEGWLQSELARKYGVSGPTVWSIVHHKTWKDVE